MSWQYPPPWPPQHRPASSQWQPQPQFPLQPLRNQGYQGPFPHQGPPLPVHEGPPRPISPVYEGWHQAAPQQSYPIAGNQGYRQMAQRSEPPILRPITFNNTHYIRGSFNDPKRLIE